MTAPLNLAALAGPPPRHKKAQGCQVGRLLNQLTTEERALVVSRLEDPAWPNTVIAEALGVKPSAIGHHARKACTCE